MPQVPYKPVQSVMPSGQPMAYSQVRADPSAFGAGIGRSLENLGETLNQYSAFAERRAAQTQSYTDLTKYNEFTGEVDRLFQESKRAAPANGLGYEKSWTEGQYMPLAKKFEEGLSPEERLKYAPKLEALKNTYRKSAFEHEFATQDNFSGVTINKTLDDARLDLNQNPANLGQWQQSIDTQIDASTLPTSVKADAKRKAREALELQTYKAEARGNPEFAQSALGVVPKGGFRETVEDRQITPQAREVLRSRLTSDKDAGLHVDQMRPRFANSLAKVMEAVPGLEIYSGTRSPERQQELWDASDKSGEMIGHPDSSMHVKGGAADLQYNGVRLDKIPAEKLADIKLIASQYGLNFRLDTPERRARGKAEPWHIEEARDSQRQDSPGLSVESKIIGVESGGVANARNPNSSASGLAQFTSGTWLGTVRAYASELMTGRSEAEVLALRNNPQIARTMLKHHTDENRRELQSAGYEQTDANLYLLHFLGKSGGIGLLRADDNQPAEAVVAPDQVAANKSVLQGKTVGDVKAWAAKKMGDAPALGADRTYYANRPADPRFANIPFDQRVAATNDAIMENQQAALQAAQETKQLQQGQLNNLLVGINDGTAGQADILAARGAGWLTDYDDIKKAEGALEQKATKLTDTEKALNFVSDTNVADPTDSDNKKAMNTLFDMSKGAAALSAMDNNYVNTGLLPLLDRKGMIPESALGVLAGMVRSQDQKKFGWALGVADQMSRQNSIAWERGADEDTKKALTFWRGRKDYVNQEKLMDEWQKFRDPSMAQARETLKENGLKLAREIDNSVVTDYFDSGLFDGEPAMPILPQTSQQLRNEFNTLFADNYALSGNEEIAKQVSLEQLGTKWGPSAIGTEKSLMKFPPEKYYKLIGGSFDWIERQAVADLAPAFAQLGLPEGTQFGLVAGPNTAAQANSGQPPKYNVWYMNAQGFSEALIDEKGGLISIGFDPKAALALQDERFGLDRSQSGPVYEGAPDPVSGVQPVRQNSAPATDAPIVEFSNPMGN